MTLEIDDPRNSNWNETEIVAGLAQFLNTL
jgi:hypothetical protein